MGARSPACGEVAADLVAERSTSRSTTRPWHAESPSGRRVMLTSAEFEEVTASWDSGAVEIVRPNADIDARVFGESYG
jgi:hypothetical protein